MITTRARRVLAGGVAFACVLAGPTAVADAASAPAQPAPTPTEQTRAAEWNKFGPTFRVLGRSWDSNRLPQKRWVFRFHRARKSNGKRQVNVRWQWVRNYPDNLPRPRKWRNKTRRINPGGKRRIALRTKPCGKKLGVLIDVRVRRSKPRKPRRWGKWQQPYGIYSTQACG